MISICGQDHIYYMTAIFLWPIILILASAEPKAKSEEVLALVIVSTALGISEIWQRILPCSKSKSLTSLHPAPQAMTVLKSLLN